MTFDRTKILFVAHGADRSGPPRALLALAQWLCAHEPVELEFGFLRGGGELLRDFWELGPVWELDDDAGPEAPRAERRRTADLRRRWAHLDDFDVLYINTAWSARALRYLPKPRRALIAHVHELDIGFGHLLPGPDRERLLRTADRFIVGCEAVHTMLHVRHGVPHTRVSRHPYFLVGSPPPGGASSRPLRAALGIPDEALVAGTVGVTEWRKGPDLFLEIASMLSSTSDGRPVHFVWVGGRSPGQVDARPDADELEALGLTDRVHFVGHKRDLWAWYGLLDVFVLPSREDAFPLVCVEAAAVGVPTVAFDNGGIIELLAGKESAGCVVPYPRVDQFVRALASLLDDESLRRRTGATAQRLVQERHTVEQCVPPLTEEILELASPRRP